MSRAAIWDGRAPARAVTGRMNLRREPEILVVLTGPEIETFRAFGRELCALRASLPGRTHAALHHLTKVLTSLDRMHGRYL